MKQSEIRFTINKMYDEFSKESFVNDLFTKFTIKKRRRKRSLDQNALYWLWLTIIEEITGNEKEDLHCYFKETYLKKEYIKIFGSKINKDISTTNLDTKQFTEYLKKIDIFANTELNIILPHPDDKNFDRIVEHYKDMI